MKKKAKKRLALIGTNGIPANYGGAETFFENLTKYLTDKYDITVYCSNKTPKQEGNTFLGAKLKYYNLSANGWQAVIYDSLSLIHAARYSDILFTFVNPGAPVINLLRFFGFKKKIIINAAGLKEWEREHYSNLERWYMKVCNRLNKKNCIWVSDNQLLVDALEETFGIKSQLIRYGGDNAFKVSPTKALLKKYPFLNEEYFVDVSRAIVDNNLEMVLNAFSFMPEKKLVLVSNFDSSDYGKAVYEQYKDYTNIVLIKGIYDKTELNAVRSNAKAYIHSQGWSGTPPSLCEALSLRLPIISFDTEVNREVTQNKALFFRDEKELETIIKNLSDNSLVKLAEESKMLADKEYTWQHICDQYCELFEN